MPLYEYKCASCGEVFEIIQKFSDTPLAVHEKCGGAVERLISTSALQFKGSGWYVNDYGKGNSKEPKSKSDSANGDHKSDSAKSDKDGKSTASSDSSKSDKSSKSDTSSKTDSKPAASSTPTAPKSDK